MGGKKPFTLANEEAWIRARVEAKPAITGRELLAELNQRGIEISYYGIWHFVDHVGLSFKKPSTPANRTALTSRAGGGNGSSTRTKSPPVG
jgi:putative transposase